MRATLAAGAISRTQRPARAATGGPIEGSNAMPSRPSPPAQLTLGVKSPLKTGGGVFHSVRHVCNAARNSTPVG